MYSQIFFVLFELLSDLILLLLNKEGINVTGIVLTDTHVHFYFIFHFSSTVIGIAHLLHSNCHRAAGIIN